MKISKDEINLLRKLGEKYMEYASLSVQKEKMNMWKALNRCEMKRPMVIIDQLPWHELEEVAPEALKCKISDPYWRGVERDLRETIYKWENFPVDMVLEPYITIPASVYISYPEYGIELDEDVSVKVENETASSHYYKSVISEFEDINKIKDTEIINNPKQSIINLQEAEVIFSGIAPVKLSHGLQFSLGFWDRLSTYIGVENVYYDLVDCPEFLHAAMRRITDAALAGIKKANELEVYNDISSTCHCSYVYTDELLPDFGIGKGALTKNSWAFGLAQLFTAVSKDVTAEFELPYISEVAEKFGMIYYGCCDRLDDRLDVVSKIPNVRKISCSPWSDRDAFARNLDKKYVMSSKPNPSYLAGSYFDEEAARNDIIHTYRAAKENNVTLELILKDLSTVNYEPSRLTRWHEIAMEIVMGG